MNDALSAGRCLFDRREHALVGDAVAEIRRRERLVRDRLEQFVHGVDERVFVADDVARPPGPRVWVSGVGYRIVRFGSASIGRLA